jgi:hypothetical protein
MTHTHDNFEFLSQRDYIDTKSWLAYDQNSYSTHCVRSRSCHREMSLGYDILLAITRLYIRWHEYQWWLTCQLDFFTLWQHLDAPSSPRHLSSPRQYNLELQQHHQNDSAALSPVWLDIYIMLQLSYLGSIVAIMTQQHHRQHDSASTS